MKWDIDLYGVFVWVAIIVGIIGIFLLFAMAVSGAIRSISGNDPEQEGVNASVNIICSDEYSVGFWFVEYDTYRDYYVAERMSETEYALYCVK